MGISASSGPPIFLISSRSESLNEILGEGGFTSRLMKEVREKHGLAYMVGSLMQTSFYTNPGEWFAYCQPGSEKTAEAISLIINIVRDLRKNSGYG